ncbi:MAG: flagellar biosynthesis protein FlhA [Planctomycetota bacterium]
MRELFDTSRAFVFPVLIVTAIFVIVAPLPAPVMDLLLAGNITVAVLILLTTIYVAKPLEFSVFPAILLGTTLSRLVLNVASTRLILARGATDGTDAAGGVIEAFGSFISGDSLVIGLILFVILIAIQFLVITKGATRISEVAARFALDGMPGKQMAIDADLNAGIITQEVAKQRREDVTAQADFYGSMDGASKFVRGDAIASIVITLINIVGGLYVGIVDNGMAAGDAASLFTTLTIGDGLVTQIPGFLISLAAALVVTRTSNSSDLPKDVVGQLFKHPEAMFLAAAFLGSLAFTGLPATPLIALSIGCVFVGLSLRTANAQAAVQEEQAAATEQAEQQARPEPKPEDDLLVDPMGLELGVGLLKLADPGSGGDLLDRVTRVRHKIAQELGFILPKVRIRDNIRLGQRDYQVLIRDVSVASGAIYPDARLAIDTGATEGRVGGVETTEPAFGRPAVWIDPTTQERAELLGYNVVEPNAALLTHLTEVVREHAAELLSRQQVHELIEHLKSRAPQLVEELVPEVVKPGLLHMVLANLLRERVPVRDLETVLETLGDYAGRTQEPTILTEYVRHGLSRTICKQYRDADRVLHCVTLDPSIEDTLAAGIEFADSGLNVKLPPAVTRRFTDAVSQTLEPLVTSGRPAVLVCGPTIRAGVRQIIRTALPKLAVISLNEITRDTDLESHGQVSADALAGDRVAA